MLQEASRRGEVEKLQPEYAEGSDTEEKVVTLAEQKEKSVVYVQDEVSEQEDDKVLMKWFAPGEPVHKQVRFEEEHRQVQDQDQAFGAARVRRRPVFTPKERPFSFTR